jgi:hypothetical protein
MAPFTKTLAALGLAITAFSAPAMADTYHHIDQLAVTIDQQSKQIVSESRHYRHAPEYRHLVSDARGMSQLADHLHEVAHHHGDLAHMASDVQQLDAKFHHLESVFDRVERRAAHGYGHVHGNTSHVKELLISIEDSIHHLQEDLESLRTPVPVRPIVSPQRTIHATPQVSRWGGYNSSRPSGYGHGGGHHGSSVYGQPYRGRGITFGGGSTRFTFRF